jgi:hypothetical protein
MKGAELGANCVLSSGAMSQAVPRRSATFFAGAAFRFEARFDLTLRFAFAEAFGRTRSGKFRQLCKCRSQARV